jgi:Outer membrane protein beta-barrel domain
MYKLACCLAPLLGLTAPALAQRPANTVGLTAAYARTQLSGSAPGYSAVGHAAYQAGLTADVYASEVLSFHPELLYTLQYYDADNPNPNPLLSRDVTFLDVPLLARYHADGLFFEAGPQVNFVLKAINEAGNDVKSDVTTVGLDYVLGLGYQLSSGPSLGLRYDGGITKTYQSSAGNGLGSGSLRNSTFLLVLGYSFGMGK